MPGEIRGERIANARNAVIWLVRRAARIFPVSIPRFPVISQQL